MADDRYEAKSIDIDRDTAVTVTYGDGHVARFDVTALRSECPCATCRGLRDRGEAAYPRSDTAAPLRIEKADLHGAWGLSIAWNDGHSTGIYPFESLRRWDEGGPPFPRDSGLGG